MGVLTKLSSSSSSRRVSVSALVWLIAFCLLCGSLPGHQALGIGHHDAEFSVPETGGGFLAKVRRLLQIIPGARIVGGDSAPEGRYPYMLSLRRSDSSHVCGAVLIHREFALTAAHCVQPGFPNSVNLNGLVAIGAYERGDDYTIRGVELVKIREVFIHPSFNPDAFYKGYDIALLQLRTPTEYAPIPLPARQYAPQAGDPVLSLGWGASSINLQQVNLKVNLTADCVNAWEGHLGGSPESSNRYLCAWNSTADTCGGDSGGPLIVAHTLRRVSSSGNPDLDTLVGITSFGDPDCHRFMLPAVYTSVAPFVEWIEETIRSRENSQALSNQESEASFTLSSPQEATPSPVVARSAEFGCTDDESCAKANRQLTVAIKDRDLTRVEGLLEIGTPPQVESVRDEIPLHVAAGKNYLAIAKTLIESGADVNFQDSEGFTALMRASVLGHIDMMRLLIGSEYQPPPVFFVDADLEITDYGAGYTALMAAAAVGAEEPLRLLIDKGADLKTDKGHFVLHIAASANAGGIISLLLDNGADVNDQDQDGNTALHVASYFGAKDALQVLLNKGADTSIVDRNGLAAVDLACGCRLIADDPEAGCEPDKCLSDADKEDLVQLVKNFSR